MADNFQLSAGTADGPIAALDEATYSGDTAKIALGRLVHVTGAEGSKTVSELVVAEDDASASTIYGIPFMMERDDALASLTPVEGDMVAPRATAEGALWVQDFNSDAILADTANMDTNIGTIAGAVSGSEMQVDIVSGNVTNAGTFAVQEDGAALTALQVIDNAIHVDDAAFTLGTSSGVVIMGFAGTQSVNANDAAALACDTDGALHVSDGGNSLTIDNSDITTIAGAVSGTEMQVDIVSGNVTNAGTFAVQVDGDALTALQLIDDAIYVDDADWTDSTSKHMLTGGLYQSTPQTVTDGDVAPFNINSTGSLHVSIQEDGVGIGGGTQYTEDDAAAANPVGNATILVRDDTPGTLTSADGDNVAQRGTNYGAAYCQIVTSSGSFVDSFGGSGGTSHADDAAFSIGSASSITPTGYLADDTTPDSVDEGDVGVPRMTLSRKPYAVITDATSENNAAVDGSGHLQVDIAADSVGIGGGTQYTLGTDTYTETTTIGTVAGAVRNDTLAALANTDNEIAPLQVNASGALYIQEGSALDVSAATVTVAGTGTLAVQEDGAALTALQLIDDAIFVDDTATHTAATTKVMGIGAVATPTDTTLNANDIGMPGMSTDRRMWTDTQIVGQDAALDVSGATVQVQSNSANIATESTAGSIQTAVELIDDAIFTDDAAYTLGTSKGMMIMGFAGTQSVNANDAAALACETDGALHIHDGGNVISTDWNGTAPPIGAGTEAAALRVTVATDSTGVVSVDDNGGNLSIDLNGTNPTLNTGTVDAGTQRVTLGTDDAAVTSLALIDDCIFTDDAAFTPATSKLAVVGAQADETSPDSVDEGDAGALRMTLARQLKTVINATSTDGCDFHYSNDLDETEEEAKATAATFYGGIVINLTNAVKYLQIFNATAASVTVGTTTPDMQIPIPANNDTDGAGFILPVPACGVKLDTAFSVAATTNSEGSGAPGANEVHAVLFYK